MNEILQFMTAHMAFVWKDGRFTIEGSTGGAGNAGIYLKSDAVRMFLVRDKGQLFLDMQPSTASLHTEWYSVDLVHQSITGAGARQTSLLDREYAKFVENHIDDIERRFSVECWEEERRRLRALARERSQRMFPR